MVKLTESVVCSRTKSGAVEHVRKLNCWGCDLDDVSILEKMPNLEVLSLSVNKISSLQPVASCVRLKELYLRGNCINDLNEVSHLRQLNELRVLWLAENPCADDPNYRNVVLRTLPRLTTLDNRPVSPEEVAAARNQYSPPPSPDVPLPNAGNMPVHSTPNNYAFRFDQFPPTPTELPAQNGSGYFSPSPPQLTSTFHQQQRYQYVDNGAQGDKRLKQEEVPYHQTFQYDPSPQTNNMVSENSNFSNRSQPQRSRENSLIGSGKAENILSAIVLLLDELDDRSLAVVIHESEKRLRRNF